MSAKRKLNKMTVMLVVAVALVMSACDVGTASTTAPASEQQPSDSTEAPASVPPSGQTSAPNPTLEQSSAPAHVDFSPSSEWANAVRMTIRAGQMVPKTGDECRAAYGYWITEPTTDGSLGPETCAYDKNRLELSPQDSARNLRRYDSVQFNKMLTECQGQDPEYRWWSMIPSVGCRDLWEVNAEN